jgi:hypothetical protein
MISLLNYISQVFCQNFDWVTEHSPAEIREFSWYLQETSRTVIHYGQFHSRRERQ